MDIKTTSLATSKLLKEAGFPQDTYFEHAEMVGYWEQEKYKSEWVLRVKGEKSNIANVLNTVSSATSDEILDKLPWQIFKNNNYFRLHIYKLENHYKLMYVYFSEHCAYVHDESLSEALAQMWIFLNKEGLLKESK